MKASVMIGLVLCIIGCSPIDPTHPLDPNTPTNLQASATLIGTLKAPTRFDPRLLNQITVYLDALKEGQPSYSVSSSSEARFAIPNIVPGQYRFFCDGPGVRLPPIFVNATAGAELDMGEVELEPIVGVIKGTAFTVVGEPASGAIVSADDEYDATLTDTEGRFALRVFAGQRILSIAVADYYTWASSPINISEGGEFIVEEPIFLLPINGTLQGSVKLRQYDTEARTQAIQVELRPQVIELPSERFSRDNRVIRRDFDLDSDGLITLENVVPGPYILSVSATGYDVHRRPVVVTPNGTTTLGQIELTHESTGPNAVQFSGRLRTGLSGLTAVSVEITIEEPTERVPYMTVLPDTNGRFTVPASSDDYYHIAADVTGFRDLDKGPYRYDPERGFIDNENEAPDINLSAAD